jgi:8-oxo-dGTP pyrophosphatase MutT (NUDIX family)
MSDATRPRPVVTVANVVERDGTFLLVEEETRFGRKLNQPAGHVEAGESLLEAAVREALEETGWHVRPTALVGIYRWMSERTGETFVRFSFAGEATAHDAGRALDTGITGALWLSYDAIVARRNDHRSPMVLRCIDDYRAGKRWPLAFVTEIL